MLLASTLALLLAVAAILGLPGGSVARAQDEPTAWSVPTRLSGRDDRSGGWFPALTTDIYGHVHVVWNGRAPARPAATAFDRSQRPSDAAGWLIYAHWDGQRWSPPSEIAAIGDEGDALRSSIASDLSGRLHLLYRGLDLKEPRVRGAENEPIRHATVDALAAERSAMWSAGQEYSRRKPAYYSDIVTDSKGVLHGLSTEADGEARYTVYYRRSEDAGKTWTSPVAVERDLAVSRWRLQLKVGPNDHLHAVWEVVDPDEPSSRNPVGFVYARSTDGGHRWATTIFAPPRKDYLYSKTFDGTLWRLQPAVGVDGRGQIVLVWMEQKTEIVYYQRSTDGVEWSAPARVAGVARGTQRPFDRYDMALDSAGRLHLVLVGYTDDSRAMSVLHSEWLGYGFGAPQVVFRTVQAPFPEWPRIAVGEGNRLHVVWFGGSLETVDRVPIGVWYSTRLTDAPRIAARATPAGTRTALAPDASAGLAAGASGAQDATPPAGQTAPPGAGGAAAPADATTAHAAQGTQPRQPLTDAQAAAIWPSGSPVLVGVAAGAGVLLLYVVVGWARSRW